MPTHGGGRREPGEIGGWTEWLEAFNGRLRDEFLNRTNSYRWPTQRRRSKPGASTKMRADRTARSGTCPTRLLERIIRRLELVEPQ